MGKETLTFIDFNGQRSSVGVHMEDVTALNVSDWLNAVTSLSAAIVGMTVGNLDKRQALGVLTDLQPGLPSNEFAQRDTKFIVRFITAQSTGEFTIPTADLSLLSPNSSLMDTTSAEYAALVAALVTTGLFTDKYGNVITGIKNVQHIGGGA